MVVTGHWKNYKFSDREQRNRWTNQQVDTIMGRNLQDEGTLERCVCAQRMVEDTRGRRPTLIAPLPTVAGGAFTSSTAVLEANVSVRYLPMSGRPKTTWTGHAVGLMLAMPEGCDTRLLVVGGRARGGKGG